MKIYVSDIINKCNGILLSGFADLECISFSKDTRSIDKTDVYLAIKGESFDGNIFYEDAFKKGCKICILDNKDIAKEASKKYPNNTIILVDDVVEALQKIASYKRSLYNIPVIAITGSVGKTSTKEIVASVLEKKYNVLKPVGNNNNHIGLPLTILKLDKHDCLVVEMGMNHFNEISLLSNIAKPTLGIITNIGTAHIGNLGSRENILKAKLELLEGMDNNSPIIINNDNDILNKNHSKFRNYDLITVGINNKSDYMASCIKYNNNGITYKIDDLDININILSDPFVYNSLIAYAVGKIYNISNDDIQDAIKNFNLVGSRLNILDTKRGFKIIDDTYNASYDSVIAAINTLSRMNTNRKIAVLGDILELGEYSKQIHEDIGKYLIDKIDVLITVGSDSKYISNKVIELGFNKENIYNFDKQEDTYEFLNKYLKGDDIILLKGSHGINLTKVVDTIKEYK